MRLVIDTNILISSLLASSSLPAHLIVLWREGSFDLLSSDDQIDELMRVMRHPKFANACRRLLPAVSSMQSGTLRSG